MEEDIKVLENFIRVYKELNEKSTDFYFNKAEIPIEIIENLIEKYKNVKKSYILATKYKEEQYIPKSKVREKIEALDDIESEYSKKILNISKETATFTIFVQEILKQLLQEGDK